MKPQSRLILGFIWLIAVLAGTIALAVYHNTPGPATRPPRSWPACAALPLATGKPTVIMFAHPRCPCTRAALTELADVLTRHPGKASASIAFMLPENPDQDWTHSDLWDQARDIQAVISRPDPSGTQAALFNASTSGHTVVYSPQGALLFSGAITPSRGHTGPSDGKSAIIQILSGLTPDTAQAPVFGCSLTSKSITGSSPEATCCP